MTPKEINDLKKHHNKLLAEGQRLYAILEKINDELDAIQKQLQEAEGDDYDAVPLIFGSGFWINPDLE
jgi:regulator of replication initiation timing